MEQKNFSGEKTALGINSNYNTQNSGKKDEKDKIYTLSNILSKLNKSEPNIFGNFYVDFSDMFNDPSDYQKYMKKNISLSNNDSVDKKVSKNNFQSNSLKPSYFEKFHLETLFYIFYYMPRDALQNYAADELNKRKWKYHIDLALWFEYDTQSEDKNDKNTNDNLFYFNPNEWKICKYGYGPINKSSFLLETEITKLVKVQNNQVNPSG